MNILSIIFVSLAVQAAPQPDIDTLIPEIIQVAVDQSPWGEDGVYPSDRPVAVDFASFVSEFAKIAQESDTKVAKVVGAVKEYRVVKGQAKPWCASDACEEIGEGNAVLFVAIRDMEQTPDGYRMRIIVTHPVVHDGRYASGLESFGVAFERNETGWTHRLVGRHIRGG